jgi:hypothetical protein
VHLIHIPLDLFRICIASLRPIKAYDIVFVGSVFTGQFARVPHASPGGGVYALAFLLGKHVRRGR